MSIRKTNKCKANLFQPAKRLTVAEVQASEGFENMTDQEAEKYIDDLEQFCRIICLIQLKKGVPNHDYQQAA